MLQQTATHCNILQQSYPTTRNRYAVLQSLVICVNAATHCNTLQHTATHWLSHSQQVCRVAESCWQELGASAGTCCSMLQRVAVWSACCSILLRVVCCNPDKILLCSTEYCIYCGVLQYVAVCCSMLQYVAVCFMSYCWYLLLCVAGVQHTLNLCYDSFTLLPWLTHVCDTTHSCECHDSFICVQWHIHMYAITHSHLCHEWSIHVPWHAHMCAMTHSFVWHDTFKCVPWLIHMCAMTHSCACHDSFICVPWLIHVCAMTHPCVCHVSFTCLTWRLHMLQQETDTKLHQLHAQLQKWHAHTHMRHESFMCVPTLIYVYDITRSCALHVWLFMCVTWLIYMLQQVMDKQLPQLQHTLQHTLQDTLQHESNKRLH